MELFITSVHKESTEYLLGAISKDGKVAVHSKKEFKPGTYVHVDGECGRIDRDMAEIKASAIYQLKGKEKEKAKADIELFISKNCKLRDTHIFSDQMMKKLDKYFDAAASKIQRAVFLHQPIVLRHDNDTDGLCAGLAIYGVVKGALHLKVTPQEWPLYKILDAEADLRFLQSFEAEYLNPILICADFGANPESIEGYKLVKKAGFEIIVIDHHPMQDPNVKKLIDVLVSPWIYNSGSGYVTGLLSAEIAQRISGPIPNLTKFVNAALTADRSKLVKPTKESEKYAEAIEYLISTSKFPQNIETFQKTINDEETIDLAYAQAQEKIGEMLDKLKKFTKTKEYGNVSVFLVDTDKLSVRGQYPKKGVVTNAASDFLANKLHNPAIVIGYSQRNFNIRLNTAALKAGINGSQLVTNVKKEVSYAIEGGGGHPAACAIRVKIGYSKLVLDQLLKEIKNIQTK